MSPARLHLKLLPYCSTVCEDFVMQSYWWNQVDHFTTHIKYLKCIHSRQIGTLICTHFQSGIHVPTNRFLNANIPHKNTQEKNTRTHISCDILYLYIQSITHFGARKRPSKQQDTCGMECMYNNHEFIIISKTHPTFFNISES